MNLIKVWTVKFARIDGKWFKFEINGNTKEEAIINAIEEAEDEMARGFRFNSISDTYKRGFSKREQQ
ncbi:hypothetical protein [Aquitalea pelogenes]|uniref:hypothetical protein n=1 Tax=Aquitalea pelogenes TaxID=1293573 RepID=UPI0035B326D4